MWNDGRMKRKRKRKGGGLRGSYLFLKCQAKRFENTDKIPIVVPDRVVTLTFTAANPVQIQENASSLASAPILG